MALEERDDVVTQAVLDLGAFFYGKPRVASIVFAFALQLQELETATWEVLNDRILANATDAQLDTLGAIVGEARLGRTDAEYRIAISGRILTNRSNGWRSDLLRLLDLMRPGESYDFDEGVASIDVIAHTDDHDLDRIVLPFLREAAAAGVAVNMVAPATTNGSFDLSDAALDPVSGTTDGFSSTTETALGGELATVL